MNAETRVEVGLVRQMAPFGLVIAPVAILVSWALRGPDGAISAALGVVLAAGNLWVSAILLSRAARAGAPALYGAALFGFLGRLGLLTVAFLLLRRLPFVDVLTLGMVLVATHLGLLIAESAHLTRRDRVLQRGVSA